MQQISLSQRVTKNELEVMMNVKILGLEVKIKRDMKGLKDGFKVYMDIMNVKLEGLTKFLQERLPSDGKVIHENHDEEKRNMNYIFRDSNVRFKNHHIPNIDMSKFERIW